jgi:hypothetical protein
LPLPLNGISVVRALSTCGKVVETVAEPLFRHSAKCDEYQCRCASDVDRCFSVEPELSTATSA